MEALACVCCAARATKTTTTSYAVNITLDESLGDKDFLGIFATSSSAQTHHPS